LISGRATFTIVTSSSSMNVAIETVINVHHYEPFRHRRTFIDGLCWRTVRSLGSPNHTGRRRREFLRRAVVLG